MSSLIYSGEATVSASVHDGELAVEFCDANIAQRCEPAGPLNEGEDDDQLADMIADSIRVNADDLAEEIVKSLRERLAKDATDDR